MPRAEPASDGVPRGWWLVALATVLATRLFMMAALPLTDTTEARYAAIARLMAETGDWITPWFEPGVPFWGKPPLAFWASALSMRLLGEGEWAVRLPSFVAALATLALLHRFAHSQWNTGAARWAVLIYATSLLPFVMAGAVLMDAWLTLAVTLSLVSLAMLLLEPRPGAAWQWGLWAGLALGLLAKGPLALVLVLGVALPWVAWHRLGRRFGQRVRWIRGMALLALLAAPWYVAAERATPGFLEYFLLGEHFYRFTDAGWQGDLYGGAHQRPRGSIWLDALLALLPWSAVGLWAFAQVLRRARARGGPWPAPRRDGDARLGLLLLWMLAAPCLFTLSGNILWTYVLPSLPAFALLLALAVRRQDAGTQRRLAGLAALVPAATLALTVAAAARPALLKSEKALVAYHAAHATARQPLVYLERRPFSARYYSGERAMLSTTAALPALLARHPCGLFVAVESARLPGLQALGPGAPVFSNRRHALFLMRPEGFAAAAAGAGINICESRNAP